MKIELTYGGYSMKEFFSYFCFYDEIVDFVLESINFKKTNLVLYRPVVVRETVSIDCSTNPANVDLKLLKRNQQTKKETVLKVSFLIEKFFLRGIM